MAPLVATGFYAVNGENGGKSDEDMMEVSSVVSVQSGCPSQTESLLTLVSSQVNGTGTEDNKNLTGWDATSDDACSWEGVLCDEASLIRTIELKEKAFDGTLTTEIGCIDTLKHIHLTDCGFTGTLPDEIAALPSLKMIDLSSNDLTGSIPVFASKYMTEIMLGDNKFSNSLSNSLSNHQSLEWLDVSFNYLTGSIPPDIVTLQQLKVLEMSNNMLQSSLPEGMENLKSMENLFIQNNQLTGTLSTKMFTGESSLRQIWIDNNFFSGSLPQSLSNLVSLNNLSFSGNKIQGTIPSDICERVMHSGPNSKDSIRRDQTDTQCNNLACPIDQYSSTDNGKGYCMKCPEFTKAPFLGSSDCHTTNQRNILLKFYEYNNGHDWLLDEPWTQDADLSECEWEGIECNTMGKVQNIELVGKNISGSIYEGLGYLLNLAVLDLSNNKLTGTIPVELSLPPLTSFDISGNMIEGHVPSTLCQKSDVNGNGSDGNFSCDRIACAIGTFSSEGRETDSSSCKGCEDTGAIHLATSSCENPTSGSSSNWSDDFIVGLSATLAIVAFGFVGWFIMRRMKRERHSMVFTGDNHVSVTIGDEESRKVDERVPLSSDDHSSGSSSKVSVASKSSARKEVWLDVPRI